MSEEARTLLEQAVAMETRQLDLKEKRRERSRATRTSTATCARWTHSCRRAPPRFGVNQARTRAPGKLIEQTLLQRWKRKMKVDTELYTNRLNARQQLALVRAGKVANVRLIDPATPPETPFMPRRAGRGQLAAWRAVFAGLVLATFRRRMAGAVQTARKSRSPRACRVCATVPRSRLASVAKPGRPNWPAPAGLSGGARQVPARCRHRKPAHHPHHAALRPQRGAQPRGADHRADRPASASLRRREPGDAGGGRRRACC